MLKKWWFWLIVVIIIIAIASHGGSSSDTSKSGDKSTPAKTNTQKATSAPTQQSYGIGQEVKVGDMSYIVSKKDTADQVGMAEMPTKATGKFIVLNMTVKNNGKDAVTVDSSFFKLKQADKTFEADSAATIDSNMDANGANSGFFLKQLNPDSVVTGNIVFDVAPDVASAANLQLQVQTGAFGTETQVINLK